MMSCRNSTCFIFERLITYETHCMVRTGLQPRETVVVFYAHIDLFWYCSLDIQFHLVDLFCWCHWLLSWACCTALGDCPLFIQGCLHIQPNQPSNQPRSSSHYLPISSNRFRFSDLMYHWTGYMTRRDSQPEDVWWRNQWTGQVIGQATWCSDILSDH